MPIEKILISGGTGRLDLVRQLLADTTGKPVLATEADEPVLLGAAMLGSVAGDLYDDDLRSAMGGMSRISLAAMPPPRAGIAVLHAARYRAFEALQRVACEIR